MELFLDTRESITYRNLNLEEPSVFPFLCFVPQHARDAMVFIARVRPNRTVESRCYRQAWFCFKSYARNLGRESWTREAHAEHSASEGNACANSATRDASPPALLYRFANNLRARPFAKST